MIGETIVALLCVLILLVWILAMAIVSNGQRLARIERIMARSHGYDTEGDEAPLALQ